MTKRFLANTIFNRSHSWGHGERTSHSQEWTRKTSCSWARSNCFLSRSWQLSNVLGCSYSPISTNRLAELV